MHSAAHRKAQDTTASKRRTTSGAQGSRAGVMPAGPSAGRPARPAPRPLGALVCLTMLILMLTAGTCFAQDGTEPAVRQSTTSLFQQFFWTGNVLGIALIWLLLLMSFASIAFAIKLFIDCRRAVLVPADLISRVQELLAAKQFRVAIEYVAEDASYLGRLVGAALGEAASGYNAMTRAIEEEGDSATSRLLRPVEYLNIVGNIAPMLGLFGTVYGMIVAFEALVASGGKPDPATLADGIGTALVTTFWGLVVAMPALATYALVRNKIDALTSEGITVAADLIKPFKPAARRAVPVVETGGAGGVSGGSPGGTV